MSGGFQRNLQRAILYGLAGDDEDQIVHYARLLFPEHIERSVRFGKRSEDAVIYDTYVNPKIKAPVIQDLLKIFAENRISFFSSYPMLAPFVLTDSFRSVQYKMEDSRVYPLFLPNQIAWLLAGDSDNGVVNSHFEQWEQCSLVFNSFLHNLADVTPEKGDISLLERAREQLGTLLAEDFTRPLVDFLKGRLGGFHQDLENLIDAIRTRDVAKIKALDYKCFMRGSCGVGHMYLVGVKEEKSPGES